MLCGKLSRAHAQKADVTPVLSRRCHGQAGCSLLADPRRLTVADCADLHVYMKTTYTCADSSVFLPQYLLKPAIVDNQLRSDDYDEEEEERMTTTASTTTTTMRKATTTTLRTTTTTLRTTTTTTTNRKPLLVTRPRPEIEWWGSEGMKRGVSGSGRGQEEEEQEQADSIYRGGVWLEGVSRTASAPPKVERTSGGGGFATTAMERLPEIVSGVVMNYSFIKVSSHG
jgi:hypothetical protein